MIEPSLNYAVNFLQNQLTSLCTGPNNKLLSACRLSLTQDPILWLPMTRSERSLVLRWRLGWLPGGKPKPCLHHPINGFTYTHSIKCLDMHRRLQLPLSIDDPTSFILNKLLLKSFDLPMKHLLGLFDDPLSVLSCMKWIINFMIKPLLLFLLILVPNW
ncbi:hypothetical protein G6F37_008033 [Rhizopus arrhizus]|nr:hypothetical protein G6F38_007834 [Rhizopus arrhizus]KAG1155979.1 hypothetical protein G6F37_008033 [Rhizopus arrhizus]